MAWVAERSTRVRSPNRRQNLTLRFSKLRTFFSKRLKIFLDKSLFSICAVICMEDCDEALGIILTWSELQAHCCLYHVLSPSVTSSALFSRGAVSSMASWETSESVQLWPPVTCEIGRWSLITRAWMIMGQIFSLLEFGDCRDIHVKVNFENKIRFLPVYENIRFALHWSVKWSLTED